MMNLREILTQVQADIVANLNSYIEASQLEDENWFHTLSFHDDAPKDETDRYRMGIYLASPDGEVYTATPAMGATVVTLDCILDDKIENSNVPEKYLSAIIEYLQGKRYGVSSNVTTAVSIRTDLGAPYNGFAVAINVTVYISDYDL